MKLKSLLLGSAAVLVAVSGARAADAIVVEPEPVEYVRICDAYGPGFFYIPGTETCLRINGHIRIAYTSAHYHEEQADATSAHDARVRGRLQFDARNETEYGTLQSFIRIQGQTAAGGHDDVLSAAEGPGDAPVQLDKAWIRLGGFTVGYHDDYWSRGLRYGYYEADYVDYANYKYGEGIILDYTFAANGWTFSVGAEDGNRSGEAGAPDVYAGFTYSGSGLFFGGTVYNDSSAGEVAWRARMDYDFGNGFQIGGWYASDDGKTDYVKGHQWGVTAAYQLTDTMVLWAGYNDYDDGFFDSGLPAAVGAVNTSATSWTVGLDWNVVPGLEVQTTYTALWHEQETANQLNQGIFGVQLLRSF